MPVLQSRPDVFSSGFHHAGDDGRPGEKDHFLDAGGASQVHWDAPRTAAHLSGAQPAKFQPAGEPIEAANNQFSSNPLFSEAANNGEETTTAPLAPSFPAQPRHQTAAPQQPEFAQQRALASPPPQLTIRQHSLTDFLLHEPTSMNFKRQNSLNSLADVNLLADLDNDFNSGPVQPAQPTFFSRQPSTSSTFSLNFASSQHLQLGQSLPPLVPSSSQQQQPGSDLNGSQSVVPFERQSSLDFDSSYYPSFASMQNNTGNKALPPLQQQPSVDLASLFGDMDRMFPEGSQSPATCATARPPNMSPLAHPAAAVTQPLDNSMDASRFAPLSDPLDVLPVQEKYTNLGQKRSAEESLQEIVTAKRSRSGRKRTSKTFVTSMEIFERFIKTTVTEDGETFVDTSGLISRECFELWAESRKRELACPEEAFRKALVARITISDKASLPFPPKVEEAVLKMLRRKEIWPCFKNRTYPDGSPILIGVNGLRAQGYHELQAAKKKKALAGGVAPATAKAAVAPKRKVPSPPKVPKTVKR